MTWDASKRRVTLWDATFGAFDLGGIDKVEIKAEEKWVPISFGSTGGPDIILDEVFAGLKGEPQVAITIGQIERVTYEKLAPWFTGTSGTAAISGTPVVGQRAQSLAAALVLHPRDQGAEVNQDLEFFKTKPLAIFNQERDGVSQDAFKIIFRIYPDPTKLATNTESAWFRIKPKA